MKPGQRGVGVACGVLKYEVEHRFFVRRHQTAGLVSVDGTTLVVTLQRVSYDGVRCNITFATTVGRDDLEVAQYHQVLRTRHFESLV